MTDFYISTKEFYVNTNCNDSICFNNNHCNDVGHFLQILFLFDQKFCFSNIPVKEPPCYISIISSSGSPFATTLYIYNCLPLIQHPCNPTIAAAVNHLCLIIKVCSYKNSFFFFKFQIPLDFSNTSQNHFLLHTPQTQDLISKHYKEGKRFLYKVSGYISVQM